MSGPPPHFQEERYGKDGQPAPLTPPPFSGSVIWAISGRLVTLPCSSPLLLPSIYPDSSGLVVRGRGVQREAVTFQRPAGPQGGFGRVLGFGVQRTSPSPIGQMVPPQTQMPPGRHWGHLGDVRLQSPRCRQCLLTQLMPEVGLGLGSCARGVRGSHRACCPSSIPVPGGRTVPRKSCARLGKSRGAGWVSWGSGGVKAASALFAGPMPVCV